MDHQETGQDQTTEAQINLREFFDQKGLDVPVPEIVEKMEKIMAQADLDSPEPAIDEMNRLLIHLYIRTRAEVETKTPEEKIVIDDSPAEKKRKWQERRQAYRQELLTGIDLILESQDLISQNPDLSPQELIEMFFTKTDAGRLIPKSDITDQQAYLLLSNGLQYLLDHRLLQLAREKFADDPQGPSKAVAFFLGEKLSQPEQASFAFGRDVGLTFFVSYKDMEKLYPKSQNPYGIYQGADADKPGSYLNGQIMVVANQTGLLGQAGLIKRQPTAIEETVRHEKDHLVFYKYRHSDRNHFGGPNDWTPARIKAANPSIFELSIRQNQLAYLEALMAAEISAYSQGPSATEVFRTNWSVRLEELLPDSVDQLLEKRNVRAKPDTAWDRWLLPVSITEKNILKAVYPLLRREAFLSFYRGIDIAYQALIRGVEPRRLGAAVALLGIGKIDRLQLLFPQDWQSPEKNAPQEELWRKAQPIDQELPYLGEYFARYSFVPKAASDPWTEATDAIKALILKHSTAQQIKLLYPSPETIGSATTEEELNQMYFVKNQEPPPLADCPENDLLFGCAQVLFPGFNRKFFEAAAGKAQSPFNAVYNLNFGGSTRGTSPIIARTLKRASLASPKEIANFATTAVSIEPTDGEELSQFVESLNSDRLLYPLLWAATNFPQDKPVLDYVARKLLPLSLLDLDQSTQLSEFAGPKGEKVIDLAWVTEWAGFFHNYQLIRRGNESPEAVKRVEIERLVQTYRQRLREKGITIPRRSF